MPGNEFDGHGGVRAAPEPVEKVTWFREGAGTGGAGSGSRSATARGLKSKRDCGRMLDDPKYGAPKTVWRFASFAAVKAADPSASRLGIYVGRS